ncbi:hypothetical protein [Endozoicomonas sp. 8E]|uniref:hypothetical protein n=1 Tax=Endozoicomonas sp. 8E TaxID=3035692 RepID=UPI002938F96C|nr:hypothetical protein [Endozoicomonas sp. 8E]WOG28498.1 hypothetical protein P6910_02245 [Endozoicomonas sp. 8E]
MKKTLSSSLLSLLISVTIVCHAESLKRHFIVGFEQDEGVSKRSFSIKRDINSLSCNPSYLADINDDAESIFPPGDKPDSVGGYGATKSLVESISWELIFATHLLVAYKLVHTSSDSPMSTKANSWVPVEAFAAVGLLLKSYWNPDSLLSNPMDHREATSVMTQGNDPFVIITMMLPGNGQQQNQPQNEQTGSSGQQASGTTTSTGISGAITGLLTSGSGDGGESPEQPQHTYGLSCYVGSCHGVCQLRSSPRRMANNEQSLFSQVVEGLLTPVLYLAGIYFTPCAARTGQTKRSEGHKQPQHTYGFNCHIDSCHGECKFRAPSDG